MAKYYGQIGYCQTSEDPVGSGIWVETITERNYYGDVVRNSRRLQGSDRINDDVNISNQLSIVSDPYANENFHAIRYATFMGSKWKVTDVEVQYPRLILTLGGLYNARPSSASSQA